MKNITVFKWLSVMLVVLIVAAAIGCGKKESQEPTPTPVVTASPTATAPAEPTGETGTLSGLEGDVQVLRQGASAWEAATSGMKVGTGYGVKTGNDGYVLITLFDGSVMELEADTEISIEELSEASGGSTTVRINQVIGNTINRVENLVDSSSTYEVETPAGSAVVRGTIKEILVGTSGRTCVSIWDEEDTAEHSATFTGNGVAVSIAEGMISCCEAGGIPGAPFYADSSDDPLDGSTMGGGGDVSPCPPGCYLIGGTGFTEVGVQLFTQDGIEGCYCPPPSCTPPPSPCPSLCYWDSYECSCMGSCY
ncbi:MAG: FecR domain-containing protein [Dehalococcoidia bacterium]|jgi:hypothetical protein